MYFVFKGDAFAFDSKNRLAIFGGQNDSTIVEFDETVKFIKKIRLTTWLKWPVTNFDWDPFGSNETRRFLQTVGLLLFKNKL